MKTIHKLGLPVILTLVMSAPSCSEKGGDGETNTIEAPTGLSARNFDNGNVELTWTGVQSATSYNVEILPKDSPGDVSSYTSTLPKHLLLKSELDYATTYRWRVRMAVDDKKGEWSDYVQFTTRAKAPTEDFIGTWQGEPENLSIRASFLGNEVNFSDVIPSQVVDLAQPIRFVMSEVGEGGEVVDNKIYIELEDASAYIPVETFEQVSLDVRLDRTLYGQYNEPQEFKYTFDPPLAIAELPGFSEALEAIADGGIGIGGIDIPIPDLSALYIEYITYTVKSVTVNGAFDTQNPSVLRISMEIKGEFDIKATDPMFDMLLDLAKGPMPDLMSMPITLEADLTRVE